MRRGATRLSCSRRYTSATLAGLVLVAAAQMLTASSLAGPKPHTLNLPVRAVEVRAKLIKSFDKFDIGKTRFGKLEWIGGLQLISDDPHFGGWSGIALDADGEGFVAVSDAGLWMTGRLHYRDRRPFSVEDVRIGPLRTLDKSILRRDRDRDAEAVALVSGSTARGRLLIAFEQNHRIGRFDIGPEGVSAPRSYIRPDLNHGRLEPLKGLEAIAVVRAGTFKGSLVAIAERKHDGGGRHTGWLWSHGRANAFTLTDIGGFDITDLAPLPDGGLLVLERRFRWTEGIKMRIRRIASSDLAPGAAIKGEVLLEATMAQEIDNMEGLSVHQDSAGAIIVTVLSDDNFNRGLQRTILLQFRLNDPSLAAAH